MENNHSGAGKTGLNTFRFLLAPEGVIQNFCGFADRPKVRGIFVDYPDKGLKWLKGAAPKVLLAVVDSCCRRGGPRDVRITRAVTRVADGCCHQAFRFVASICVDHTAAGREIDS